MASTCFLCSDVSSRLAHHCKAILLLDEADVFVQSRLILTTNRVKDIDNAIQSRISVALHYGPLGLDTRKTIWESFLKKVATAQGRAEYIIELDKEFQKDYNGAGQMANKASYF